MTIVLCFGDSNTHGSIPMRDRDDSRRFGPDERWPGVLRKELGAGFTVIEEGLPGRTTLHDDPIEGVYKNGLWYLRACLESHRPVDIMTLMLGTNDLKSRFAVQPLDIAESVGILLETIAKSGAGPNNKAPRVLLIAPPPLAKLTFLGDMFHGGTEKSQRLGAAYRPQAEKYGTAFLDAGTVIRTSDTDGVHFEPGEHAKLGKAVAGAIRAMGGMISLVIFDCDGVLIDSEIISATVLVEELARQGVAIEMSHVLEHFIGHPYAVVAGKIAAIAGAPLPDSFELTYRTKLARRFDAELCQMPGILDVLDALAVPYCAATSSNTERARQSLRAAGLAERFGDRVYTVSMVARPKPAPDLFLHAAKAMGVDPKNCLVIEDSDLGIAAAQAAGMRAWQFTGGSHYAGSHRRPTPGIKPDRSFHAMTEFFAGAPHLRR